MVPVIRLLSAWCVRCPGGYCQGMNFCAAVLLVVMQHGAEAADVAASAEPRAGSEETAFWTFVAIMERLMPLDFYQLPSMAGLQCDVRVLQQLVRTEVPSLHRAGIGEEELAAVLKLTAYKWLIPCYVNQLPISTLLHYWHKLLLRPPMVDTGPAPPPQRGQFS